MTDDNDAEEVLDDEAWMDDARRHIDGLVAANANERSSVYHIASRIIDKLRIKKDRLANDHMKSFTDAPSGIPHVKWKSDPLIGRKRMDIVGDIGGFYADTFNDNKPSSVFNAGFYAGVLATKLGLVNPEDFTHDEDDRRQPPTV